MTCVLQRVRRAALCTRHWSLAPSAWHSLALRMERLHCWSSARVTRMQPSAYESNRRVQALRLSSAYAPPPPACSAQLALGSPAMSRHTPARQTPGCCKQTVHPVRWAWYSYDSTGEGAGRGLGTSAFVRRLSSWARTQAPRGTTGMRPGGLASVCEHDGAVTDVTVTFDNTLNPQLIVPNHTSRGFGQQLICGLQAPLWSPKGSYTV